MNVKQFRERIRFTSKVIVEGQEFKIQQLIKFRLDDGSHYMKLFFTNGYVFADDLEENMFILVKRIDTDFQQPFPKQVKYDNKKFKFTYQARAVAEKVTGEGEFKVGDAEKFWDYETSTGDYLSLGLDEKTKERMDLTGKIVDNEDVSIV
jgi:hypothetical protein